MEDTIEESLEKDQKKFKKREKPEKDGKILKLKGPDALTITNHLLICIWEGLLLRSIFWRGPKLSKPKACRDSTIIIAAIPNTPRTIA